MIEEFRPVVGYEGLYRVSNYGRVYSHSRDGFLKAWPNDDGYLQVGLSRDSHKKHKRVHTLVLEAFVGPCPQNCEARHLDHDKANPRLDNLEWAPTSVNMQDNVARGLYRDQAKLTDEQVRFIRTVPLERGKTNSLCRQLGISRSTFHVIRRRERYKHVGD